MTDRYADMQQTLKQRGMCSYMQRADQLVASHQRGPAWPDRGNSFWVSWYGDRWHLCTWAFHAWRVPPETDVAELAEAFVAVGDIAQVDVPDEMIARFGLVRLNPDELDAFLNRL